MTKKIEKLVIGQQFETGKPLWLPLEIITAAVGGFGRRRMGKTYKFKLLAEEMLRCRQQIVVIDPTDAWWGLRAGADGDPAGGYPITIFGGRHGDFKLEGTAEEAEELALAICEDDFSAIFSLKGMSRAQEHRFLAPFFETIYRKNPQKALHLFMDEADIYAPQMPAGDEARTLGACQNIIRRGGLDGLGASVITQRPAVLNKSIVTQCDMIIATCLSHPLDLKPVEDWMKVYVSERSLVQEVIDSLPSLSKGQAWVWAPDYDIRELAWFRELRTFDSGRTPKPGEKRRVPRSLSKVDLAALDERIKARAAIHKANDPRALKARIAELEKQVAKGIATNNQAVLRQLADPPEPAKAKLPAKDLDRVESLLKRAEAGHKALANVVTDLDAQRDRLAQAHQALVSETGNLVTAVHNLRTAYTGAPASPVAQPVGFSRDRGRPGNFPPAAPAPVAMNGHAAAPRGKIMFTGLSGDQVELDACSRKFLTVIAQHQGDGMTKARVRTLAGYANSGTTSDAFALLLREGLVVDENGFKATQRGLQVLGPFDKLPVGSALADHVLASGKLSPPEVTILTNVRAAYPNAIQKAAARGHYANSGTVSDAFAALTRSGYIVPSGKAQVKLAAELAD